MFNLNVGVKSYLHIKDPGQKHHSTRYYGVNRNIFRRNPFSSDQDKRYFVNKKRMYPLGGLVNSGRNTPVRHPKSSSFVSGDSSSLSLLSDGASRLLSSSDNHQHISGTDSIGSIDPNLQDNELGTFTSEIGDDFLVEDDDDQIQCELTISENLFEIFFSNFR